MTVVQSPVATLDTHWIVSSPCSLSLFCLAHVWVALLCVLRLNRLTGLPWSLIYFEYIAIFASCYLLTNILNVYLPLHNVISFVPRYLTNTASRTHFPVWETHPILKHTHLETYWSWWGRGRLSITTMWAVRKTLKTSQPKATHTHNRTTKAQLYTHWAKRPRPESIHAH